MNGDWVLASVFLMLNFSEFGNLNFEKIPEFENFMSFSMIGCKFHGFQSLKPSKYMISACDSGKIPEFGKIREFAKPLKKHWIRSTKSARHVTEYFVSDHIEFIWSYIPEWKLTRPTIVNQWETH